MTTAPVVEASTAGLIEAGPRGSARAGKRGVDRTYRRTGRIRHEGASAESPAAREPSAEAARPAGRGGNRREYRRRGGIRTPAGAPLALDHVRRIAVPLSMAVDLERLEVFEESMLAQDASVSRAESWA